MVAAATAERAHLPEFSATLVESPAATGRFASAAVNRGNMAVGAPVQAGSSRTDAWARLPIIWRLVANGTWA